MLGRAHKRGKQVNIAAQWQQWALVMAGGALGAAGRFWLSGALLRSFGDRLPWGTLAVNLVGSFAVGFLAEWLQGRGPVALYWRVFLIVGVLGALTTYSSLMLECLLFARSQRAGLAAGYLALTLVAGVLLVWVGARLGGWFRG
jgi:CrcB protein